MEPSPTPWRVIDAEAEPSPALRARSGSPAAPPVSSRATLAAVVAIAGLAVAAVVIGTGALALPAGDAGGLGAGLALPTGDPGGSAARGELVVDVGGAVVAPGVYRLPAGSRVADALAAAGGFGPRVDAVRAATTLNLAAPLEDGAQVIVPSRDDPTVPDGGGAGGGSGEGAGGGSGVGGLVDLNSATQAELEALPGIGPVSAGKIIAAREEQPFASVDELRTRKILGQKTFEALRDLVTVR
ncbi:MAG: ComEA family DNA-binding protein [Chloroflexi bacterium]|nr:ComEA family DNA-binding protein [Chloroflexota bacterium]